MLWSFGWSFRYWNIVLVKGSASARSWEKIFPELTDLHSSRGVYMSIFSPTPKFIIISRSLNFSCLAPPFLFHVKLLCHYEPASPSTSPNIRAQIFPNTVQHTPLSYTRVLLLATTTALFISRWLLRNLLLVKFFFVFFCKFRKLLANWNDDNLYVDVLKMMVMKSKF